MERNTDDIIKLSSDGCRLMTSNGMKVSQIRHCLKWHAWVKCPILSDTESRIGSARLWGNQQIASQRWHWTGTLEGSWRWDIPAMTWRYTLDFITPDHRETIKSDGCEPYSFQSFCCDSMLLFGEYRREKNKQWEHNNRYIKYKVVGRVKLRLAIYGVMDDVWQSYGDNEWRVTIQTESWSPYIIIFIQTSKRS